MANRIILVFICLTLFCSLISGCSRTLSEYSPTADNNIQPSVEPSDGALTPGIIQPIPEDNIQPIPELSYFPVQKEVPEVYFDSLLEGKLIVEDGFIRAVNLSTGDSFLVIWPHGYLPDFSDNNIWIINEKGQPVARIGDNVKFGGNGGGEGEQFITSIATDVLSPRTGQIISNESIQGTLPFWTADSVEFYPFFPVYSADLLETNRINAPIEGNLDLDQGYLRLVTASGKSYLLIWPLLYDVRKNNHELVINGKDMNGQFYINGASNPVFIGTRVKVLGWESTAEDLKKYIWYPLPEDWMGPFWVVTGINNAG